MNPLNESDSNCYHDKITYPVENTFSTIDYFMCYYFIYEIMYYCFIFNELLFHIIYDYFICYYSLITSLIISIIDFFYCWFLFFHCISLRSYLQGDPNGNKDLLDLFRSSLPSLIQRVFSLCFSFSQIFYYVVSHYFYLF